MTNKLGGFMSGLSAQPFRDKNAADSHRDGADGLSSALADMKLESRMRMPPRGPTMSAKDQEILRDPRVVRLARVTQMFFLQYYVDLLNYVKARKLRFEKMHAETLPRLPEGQRQTALVSYLGRERVQLRKRRCKTNSADFDVLTQVGQGGYGQVFLARKRDTKEVCALKVINKKLLLKLDETQHILTERDILTQAAKSEWLVKLLYSFQDHDNLYLAMEFVPGGDFRTLLNNTGTLGAKHTRFYMAEMFLALDALHQLNFIHRDLKPENFLISADGHIKLTDFGLAAGQISPRRIESLRRRLDHVKDIDIPYLSMKERQHNYRTARLQDIAYANSVVGSPDYMALEVLQGQGYDYTVDYWSMGCMLFEALTGFPPFSGRNSDETYANLQNWQRALRRPQYENGQWVFSDRTWAFIKRLITVQRARFRSFAEIAQDPYFAETDFVHIRDVRPPFVPDLEGDADPGYFDDFENEADMKKYKEVMNKRAQIESMEEKEDASAREFVGFTYRHNGPSDVYGGSTLRDIRSGGEGPVTLF